MSDILRIGPSGNSEEFYKTGRKHTEQEAEWLNSIGLNAFEYSFGRGISLTEATALRIGEAMKKYDIALSVHAPYYINFANRDPEMVQKSFGYILDSVNALKTMGGDRVIFHPAACGKMQREEAVSLAADNIAKLMAYLDENTDGKFILCPETMGKRNQIGTPEEIIDFCKIDSRLYPCFDFGHINSFYGGSLKTADDFKRVIDIAYNGLGEYRAKNMHVHFSKIQYGVSGEIRHLTFEDNIYGPDPKEFAEAVNDYGMTPHIICESDGTMSGDALIIKNYLKNI